MIFFNPNTAYLECSCIVFLESCLTVCEWKFSCACCFTDRRRTELIPEEVNRQHVQTLQDSLIPDIQKNLEDFR